MKKSNQKPARESVQTSDFLPPPDKLMPAEKVTKITLTLDISTIESFKNMADRYGTKYQRMMREVLKGYANKYET